jgi:hypothetical protein
MKFLEEYLLSFLRVSTNRQKRNIMLGSIFIVTNFETMTSQSKLYMILSIVPLLRTEDGEDSRETADG